MILVSCTWLVRVGSEDQSYLVSMPVTSVRPRGCRAPRVNLKFVPLGLRTFLPRTAAVGKCWELQAPGSSHQWFLSINGSQELEHKYPSSLPFGWDNYEAWALYCFPGDCALVAHWGKLAHCMLLGDCILGGGGLFPFPQYWSLGLPLHLSPCLLWELMCRHVDDTQKRTQGLWAEAPLWPRFCLLLECSSCCHPMALLLSLNLHIFPFLLFDIYVQIEGMSSVIKCSALSIL